MVAFVDNEEGSPLCCRNWTGWYAWSQGGGCATTIIARRTACASSTKHRYRTATCRVPRCVAQERISVSVDVDADIGTTVSPGF